MLIVIWPIFALICFGAVLRRSAFAPDAFWSGAERLNYFILFPALLLSALAKAPVRDPQLWQFAGAALMVLIIGAVGICVWRFLFDLRADRFGVYMQGALRFNTYLAIAILAALGGDGAIERAAVYLGLAVPVVNILAILAFSDGGIWRNPWQLLRKVGTNPLVVACLLGLVLAATNTGLPFGMGAFFALLGQGSLPLGLLCVGAALRLGALRQDVVPLAMITAARLVIMPSLALFVAQQVGLARTETLVLVLFSAVPTAPTSYVLTSQMGGDAPLMAGVVTAQTLVSVVTITLVLQVVL